jgi:hypothetical protein
MQLVKNILTFLKIYSTIKYLKNYGGLKMERKAEILLDLTREVNSYNGCFEDLTYTFKDLEELIEVSGKSGVELIRATFLGT